MLALDHGLEAGMVPGMFLYLGVLLDALSFDDKS